MLLKALDRIEATIGGTQVGRAGGAHPLRSRRDVEGDRAHRRPRSPRSSRTPTITASSARRAKNSTAIVQATEKATSDILACAERIQEMAWTLREQGVESEVCDLLDANATEVYTACSFQDITGQRTRKVIGVLRYLEDRINAMIGIWGLDGAMAAEAAEQPARSTRTGRCSTVRRSRAWARSVRRRHGDGSGGHGGAGRRQEPHPVRDGERRRCSPRHFDVAAPRRDRCARAPPRQPATSRDACIGRRGGDGGGAGWCEAPARGSCRVLRAGYDAPESIEAHAGREDAPRCRRAVVPRPERCRSQAAIIEAEGACSVLWPSFEIALLARSG